MRKLIVFMLAFVLAFLPATDAQAMVYGEEGYLLEGYDEDSAWEIDSLATFVKMRDDINDGTITMGRYYKLTTDLDISGYTDWAPIGTDKPNGRESDHPFSGHFDGNGHTITVNISRSEKRAAGLFGYVSGAIKNLTVKGNVKLVAMTAVEYPRAGGIACWLYGGTISGCKFEGNVTLSSTSTQKDICAGGIAAIVRGATISDCKFDGKVNALASNANDYVYAGGITGYANSYQSSNACKLTKNSVGSKDETTVIKALYSYYSNGRTYAGGIVGYSYNSTSDTTVTGNYSRIRAHAGHAETQTYGYRYTSYGKFADNEEKKPADTPIVETSALVYGAEGYLLEGYDEGSAWIIDSVATFVKMRDDINDGTMPMGRYYKLTTDLDISGYTDWTPIGTEKPVGTESTHPFLGHFDGNGHTITVDISRSEKRAAGLFGYVSGAIKNLTVKGNVKLVALTAVEYPRAGGIACWLYGGTISGCRFDGNVTLSSTSTQKDICAGGIAAIVRSAIINECKFDGKVNVLASNADDYVYAGGITGYANSYQSSNACKLTKNSVGKKDNTTVVKAIYSAYDNNRTYAGGIIGYLYNSTSDTTVTGNYSRLKTQAGHTDTLTYGYRYTSYGKFADNEEYDPDKYTDPVPDPVDAPKITTSTLPEATMNSSYSAQLSATGGSPMTWTVNSGTLPAGITLSESGLLSGTPTTDGTYSFTVKVSNTGGDDTKGLSITVAKSAPAVTAPSITTTGLPSGVNGNAYSAALSATGDSPITWGATGLPSGLKIDASTGAVSGTPTVSGTFTVTVTATNTGGTDSKTFTLTVSEPAPVATAPTITTGSLPSGTVGSAYSATLTATGTPPITWGATGLPSGLKIDASTGAVSGTPTVSGTFTVTVTATNTGGNDSRILSVVVEEPTPVAIAPKITTTSIPTAQTGEDYRVMFEASGTAPITWVIAADKLPVGISFSEDGLLAGKTTESGTYTLTVTASNTAGTDSRTFTLIVNNPKPAATAPTITTASVPNGTTNVNYSTTFTATGTTPITWTASSLPDGFTMSESGRLTGSTKTAGTYAFIVTATNTGGSDSKTFTLTISETAKIVPPKITTESLPEATEGQQYTAQLIADGTGLTWSATGLPKNLALAKDGTLSGIPQKAGTYRVVFTVKNSAGVDSVALALVVNSLGASSKAPKITTKSLPDGFINEEYSYQLEAEGEVETWQISEGSLPEGLELDSSTGEISGRIGMSAKSFKFKVIAKDESGKTSAAKLLTLKVVGKEIGFKTETLKVAKWGSSYSCTVKPSNLKAKMWSVVGDLPAGITFDKGKFSGKPKEVGEFDLTVTASNGAVEIVQDFELTVKGIAPKLTGKFKSGAEGTAYSYVFKAKGTTPIEWDFDTLPDGLDYTPDATGENCTVSGTPQGSFSDKVAVTITNGETDEDSITKNLQLTIKAVKPKFNKSVKPQVGYVGQDYSFKFVLSKSPAELSWEFSGSLPEGLYFSDGEIYGTPTKAETQKLTVTVRHASRQGDSDIFPITVTIKELNSSLPEGEAVDPMPDSEQDTGEFVDGIMYRERGELSAEMTARIANNGEIIVAILPAIEVEESGMFEFEVELDERAKEGATLVWHSYPNGEDDPDDSDNAIFLDGDGEITEAVPDSHSVTVSAWLEPGVVYEPVIAVKLSN